jgi:hypothetical protein
VPVPVVLVVAVINMVEEAVEAQVVWVPMLQVGLVAMVETQLFKARHKEIV